MIYIFDTGSLSKLKHYPPSIFKKLWADLSEFVDTGLLISTKEVWNEMERGEPVPFVNDWLKSHKALFTTPSAQELLFVAEIFQVIHFQQLIGELQRLKGTPVADPFVIACAKIHGGTVVTEEKFKPNAAKIPNVCKYYGIECIDFAGFMINQRWEF